MTSRTRGLWLLVALTACGGGSGGGTGTGTGTGTSGPGSSGSTISSPTTSEGITGGATSSGSTSSGSTSSGSTGTSGEPLTTGGSSSTGASSTGGAGGACVDVSGDYGACEAIIGYGFDGTSCRAFSGCHCAPHCDDFKPDPVNCALECAAAGECNQAALHPAGINKDPVQQGSFCDELDACPGDPESAGWLMKIFAGAECEPAGSFCGQNQTCHLLWQGTLDAAQWSQVCAASLLPGADLQCVVWGP